MSIVEEHNGMRLYVEEGCGQLVEIDRVCLSVSNARLYVCVWR